MQPFTDLALPKADSSNFTDDLNVIGVYFLHFPNPRLYIHQAEETVVKRSGAC